MEKLKVVIGYWLLVMKRQIGENSRVRLTGWVSRALFLAIMLAAFSAAPGCKLGGNGGKTDSKGIRNIEADKPGPGPILFYVGSSDGRLGRPLFLVELDAGRTRLSVRDSFPGAIGPSYLAFSPGREFLYAIDKTVSDPVTGYMSVASFRIDGQDHGLAFLNRQSSQGAGPCHVHCSSSGNYLFTSNYGSGNIAVFPIGDRGEILPASCVAQSSGSGPVAGRQEGPHTHYVTLDPDEKYLLSPDLGSDRVLVYRFHTKAGTLVPNPDQEYLQLPPGSGPRHLVFHPSGTFVYVVNELNATVTACSYDSASGMLRVLNTVPTIPGSHTGAAYPAAIRMHPGGKYLYASTRGENSSIAVFGVASDGRISRIQVVEGVPGWPRDFNIDPTGTYLIAAGERSDEIVLYRIEQDTGFLLSTGIKTRLRAPGCILFIDESSNS